MRTTLAEAQRIVATLSLDDRIRLLSGKDVWHSEDAPGAPSVMLTDGPHGLRKQLDSGDTVDLTHHRFSTRRLPDGHFLQRLLHQPSR